MRPALLYVWIKKDDDRQFPATARWVRGWWSHLIRPRVVVVPPTDGPKADAVRTRGASSSCPRPDRRGHVTDTI